MSRIELERVPLSSVPWEVLDRFPDRTVFQTRAWLEFLEESQTAEPIVAAVLRDDQPIGWFTGGIVRRLGFKFLGSPLRGWTTSYMGFNLSAGIQPEVALEPLRRFAFRELGCVHLEIMDRRCSPTDEMLPGFRASSLAGFEVDLSRSPEAILAAMNKARRHAIRRAPRNGIVVERAVGDDFADEHYAQVCDVFAKQGLPPPYRVDRIRELIRNLAPTDNLLLVRARDAKGESIATAIVPGFNKTAYFWMGASWRAGQKLLPNEAIQWFAMNYWRDRGITAYDMGGGGDYKSKYGGKPIEVSWLRASRFASMDYVRARLLDLRKRIRRLRGRTQGLT